jgi:hypothetical protein
MRPCTVQQFAILVVTCDVNIWSQAVSILSRVVQ